LASSGRIADAIRDVTCIVLTRTVGIARPVANRACVVLTSHVNAAGTVADGSLIELTRVVLVARIVAHWAAVVLAAEIAMARSFPDVAIVRLAALLTCTGFVLYESGIVFTAIKCRAGSILDESAILVTAVVTFTRVVSNTFGVVVTGKIAGARTYQDIGFVPSAGLIATRSVCNVALVSLTRIGAKAGIVANITFVSKAGHKTITGIASITALNFGTGIGARAGSRNCRCDGPPGQTDGDGNGHEGSTY